MNLTFFYLEWWEYFIIIVLFFMAFLFINYVLKKYNEARIEDRLNRLLVKASNNQATQIHELSLEIETNKLNNTPSNDKIDKCKPQLAGISLVFNKEENLGQDSKRKDETTEVNQNAQIKELEKITEGNKVGTLQKMKAVKAEKIAQMSKTKAILPGSVVIKDSKDVCSMTLPSMDRNIRKAEETMISRFKKSFRKPSKLEPKAVAKQTDIGRMSDNNLSKTNHSFNSNLQISELTEKSQEIRHSFLKINLSKQNISTTKETNLANVLFKGANLTSKNSINTEVQTPGALQKGENALLEAKTESLSKVPSVKDVEEKLTRKNLSKSELQIVEIPQHTISLLKTASNDIHNVCIENNTIASSKLTKSELQIVEIPTNTFPQSKINNNESTEETNIDSNAEAVIISRKRINKSELKILDKPKESKDVISTKGSSSFLITQENKSNISTAKVPSSNNVLLTDSKIPYNNCNELVLHVTESLDKSGVNHNQRESNTHLITDIIEPIVTAIGERNINRSIIKDSEVLSCTESGPLTTETLPRTKEGRAQENSDNVMSTSNSDVVTPASSASSLNKRHNSRAGSTTSSITIGVLMTEVSLKTNKIYASSDTLDTEKIGANDNKTLLIPIKDTKSADDTSTLSKFLASDVSTITEELFFNKESAILLQDEDEDLEVKPTNCKANVIIKPALTTFTSSSISEPQTSVLLQDPTKRLSQNVSDTSTNKYNQRMKKFWSLFTKKYTT